MISIKTFAGESPRTEPHLLPDNAAQEAVDCDFAAGVLRGIRGLDAVTGTGIADFTGVKSLFTYDTTLYAWDTNVDAVRGPIANDAFDRFYWSDGEYVYVSRHGDGDPSGANKYKAGVPVPAAAPTLDGSSSTFPFDTSGWTYAVYCEGSDGSINNATAVTGTVGTNTGTAWDIAFSVALSCGTVGGGTGGSGITLYLVPLRGDTGLASYEIAGAFSPIFSDTVQSEYYASPPGTLYFEYAGTLPSPVSIISITTTSGESITTSPLVFYSIGNGWWSTNSAAEPPTAGTSAVAASVTTPALRIRTAAGDIVLREDSSRSTFPAVASSWGGRIDVGASTVTAYIWFESASTAIERRVYVATYVNACGEEGAPSDPLEIDTQDGTTSTIALPVPAAGHGYIPIDKIRLYRSATGGTSTASLFVDEIDVTEGVPASYADSKLTVDLGEPISTIGYLPPEAGLSGLVMLPNGILAAFKANEVHFSEQYLPYAWKTANIKTTATDVVGLCPAEGGAYAITKTHPYYISGSSPDAMTDYKITAIQAGVSKDAICNVGPFVIYASNDGLVAVRGVEASLDISFRFFTRDVWRSRYGAKLGQMRLDAHDGHVLAWFDDGTPGFLMRFDEGSPSLTELSEGCFASTVIVADDALCIVFGDELFKSIYRFNAGSRVGFVWRSKDFILPQPISFGAVQVIGSGSVDLTFYRDGAQFHTQAVTMSDTGMAVFRLPAGRYRRFSVKVEGAAGAEVTELNVAISPSEFSGG